MMSFFFFFFFKQKTAYEMRISDWSSDVCSSDLGGKDVEGTILAAGLMLVLPEIADSNPSKKIAQDYVARYTKMYGESPATFGANVFDAGLLLEKALPQDRKSDV